MCDGLEAEMSLTLKEQEVGWCGWSARRRKRRIKGGWVW